MGLQETFLEIYIFLLCVNGGILLVDASIDTPLKTPFDLATNVTGISGPGTDVEVIYNSTSISGTLVGNLSSATQGNGTNSTANDIGFFDSVNFALNTFWAVIQILTGGFVFDVLALFGFPTMFVYILQAIVGILLVRTILYYLTGR